MPTKTRIVQPGPRPGTVCTETNHALTPPEDWDFLPAGDGPLTRNAKTRGVYWQVQIKKGRRTISKGIWTSKKSILAAQAEIEAKRSAPGYTKRKETERKRREKKHQSYVQEFYQATVQFLNFHPMHIAMAKQLALAVTELATPVGSGTVARTERIPLEERVRAAVIAWMRHQTTLYESMRIARIKGKRREIRRELARESQKLLERYRQGETTGTDCPLRIALKGEKGTTE